MNDPRDFLPAKYKSQNNHSESSLIDIDEDKPKELIDSPWSDLAKTSDVPEYRSSNAYDALDQKPTQASDFSAELMSSPKTQNQDNNSETIGSSTPSLLSKKKSNSKLAGLAVVFFLVIGVFASFMLSNENQDNRNQAYMMAMPTNVGGGCDSGYERITIGGEGACVPNVAPSDTPDVEDWRFGYCYSTGQPCTPDQWEDPTQFIAGTYVWPPDCEGDECRRYVLNIPSTLEAAVEYATTYTQVNEVLYQANGNPLEIAPFVVCSNNSSSGYNTINCSGDTGSCSWVDTSVNPPRCYLTTAAYEAQVDAGQTWSPYNTGCGDGVHDTPEQSSGGYAGDCNTWHFTTCLNEGTGVNGYGCDAEIPDDTSITEEPPDNPPTTVPPTLTPPPELICTDIEMLDAVGNTMTGDDDANLVDGDQVRFRSTKSGTGNNVTFEFRILAPNVLAWQDLTNTDDSAAANVSAVYTIISSGHHIVQSRVCSDGACQDWEIVQ